MFLDILQNSQDNSCARDSFGLRPATLLKKRSGTGVFPWIFAKFLRTPFLQNTSVRLLLSFVIGLFCTSYYLYFSLSPTFVLTLASGRAVWCGDIALSILVLWTKKWYSRFLKIVFVFQKISFKDKVVKIFKISSGCHIETCRYLKRRAILKIPSTVF